MMRALLALLIVLLIAGCGGGGSYSPETVPDLNTGGKGLSMELLTNMPPDELLMDTDFKVGVLVKNEGYSPASPVLLSVSSCQAAPIGGSTVAGTNWDLIEGKTMYNPSGSNVRYIFDLQAQEEDLECLLQIELCYLYETFADPDVCVDPDIYNLKNDKVCTIQQVKPGKQGGPVVVDKIDTAMLPSGGEMIVQFKIYVKNLQEGQVVSYSESAIGDVCGSQTDLSPDRIGWNEVRASVTLGATDLDCGSGIIHMTRNFDSNFVLCSTTIPINTITYSSPLNIRLSYGYITNDYKEVTIRDFSRRR